MTSNSKSEGRFGKQDFVYVGAGDIYPCSAGERLSYRCRRPSQGARALFHKLPSGPNKRFVEIGEGTHIVMLERMQLFQERAISSSIGPAGADKTVLKMLEQPQQAPAARQN